MKRSFLTFHERFGSRNASNENCSEKLFSGHRLLRQPFGSVSDNNCHPHLHSRFTSCLERPPHRWALHSEHTGDAHEPVTEQVKTLQGLLSVCVVCKKIRDAQGHWQNLEAYLEAHSEAVTAPVLCLMDEQELALQTKESD